MQLKNKKIILTGSCGFICQEMTRQIFSENPSDFICIDKMSYMSDDTFHKENNIPVHKIDICSEETARLIVEFKPDIIIHAAAESSVDVSINDPSLFVRSNVFGTVNILNAILKMKNMPLLIAISTDEVYGDKLIGWSKEDDPRMASSPYSASKLSAEHFVESYGRTYNLPYLITRSSNNYGPYQHHEKLIPRIIQNILASKKIPVYGQGNQERDWITSKDNCEGIISVIEKYHKNDIFNIGGHETTKNIDIIKQICNLMDVSSDEFITYVEDRKGHDLRYAISCDKVFEATGWAPKTSLEAGLRNTIEWYRSR